MRIGIFLIALLTSALFSLVPAQNSAALELRKAEGHPMQYYVSLPPGWTADKKWPIVVVCEAAEKEYRMNAERFVAARQNMPFIIVAPYIVTNGNQGLRDPEIFPYSKSTWDFIDRVGHCAFDLEGVIQAVKDVRDHYSGEERFFITGFEAGAHLVWSFVFQHPEMLRGAAPIAGNYRGRCLEENNFSRDASRTELPVRGFYGARDPFFGKGGKIYSQWLEAKQQAAKNGYENISEETIPDKDHEPAPEIALKYFSSLMKNERN
jgi:poly(3-hydroxybutyrate) depolymerase